MVDDLGNPATVTRPAMTESPPPAADDSTAASRRDRRRAAVRASHRRRRGDGRSGRCARHATGRRARPVRGELPVQAGRRSPPACRCPGIVASHVWARSQWPRIDRWASGAQVIHGTNYVVPPTRLPAVVSVYDCWFLRHPDHAVTGRAPRRRTTAPARSRRAPSCTPAPTTPRDRFAELFDTDRVDDDPARAAARAAAAARRCAAAGGGHAHCAAIRSCWRSAPRSGARRCPCSSPRSDRSQCEHAELRLVLAGAEGDDSPAVVQAIAAPSTHLPRACAADRRRRRRHQALAAAARGGARLPVARRGVRVPDPRGAAGGDAGGRQRRRRRRPRSAATACCSSAGAIPPAFAAALGRAIADGGLRLGLIEAGQRNVRRFDWNDTADRLVALYRELARRRRPRQPDRRCVPRPRRPRDPRRLPMGRSPCWPAASVPPDSCEG